MVKKQLLLFWSVKFVGSAKKPQNLTDNSNKAGQDNS